MEVVRQVCDRMALLKHGKIAIDGEVKEIFLSQSDSLQGLIGGEQETISKNKIGLRICIENDQYKTFFQDIYQKAGINCNLLEGGIEKYKSGNSFIGTIEIENKDIDMTKNFMEMQKIKYEVITK